MATLRIEGKNPVEDTLKFLLQKKKKIPIAVSMSGALTLALKITQSLSQLLFLHSIYTA